MHRLSSFVFLIPLLCLPSCIAESTPAGSLQTSFYLYRFEPPAFIEFSTDFQPINEIPFSIPPHCGLFNTFPAPLGEFIAVELSCPNGQTVLFLDTNTATATQPIPDSDSHFLAWMSDGSAAYLKVDALGSPKVVRISTDGEQEVVPITEYTYDLAASVASEEFTFTFSRGLGQGSELWFAKRKGKSVEALHVDLFHYISFARYSPDGSQVAFIKIPDTQTPFTVGELWVMNSDGSNPRKLADADAGHGYAANWSPDGSRIAFVARENPDDERADQASEALLSNIYIVDLQTAALTPVTHLEDARAETPSWSPDGNTLAFQVVINDRMAVHVADLSTEEIRPLMAESTCCPAWLRK